MELSFKLLDLINKRYVINDIISELNISYEEVYKLIRDLNQLGFLFNKKYYSTNTIEISIGHSKEREFNLPIRNEENFSKRRILKK